MPLLGSQLKREMIKKSVYSKSTLFVTIILLLAKMTRPVLAQEDCKPAFLITGQQPPPGKCNTENNSDCCIPGSNYTAYWCSPAVTNHTAAVLNVGVFDKGQDSAGLARCDNRSHSDNSPVVALSTGWFNETSRCGEVIIITGNRGRIAKAVVVDECNSYSGCDVNNDYQPPCLYNAITASKAVWAALGVSENSVSYGEINVTWAPTNERVHLGKRKTNKIIIVVPFVVVVLGVLATVWPLVVYIKKRRLNSSTKFDEEEWENSRAILSEFPKRFTYSELKISTDNFNEQRKLGSGGFGSVYEGTLDDGVKTRVAVKRLDYFKQGKKEFLTEVKTTGSVHHVNLVKLVGFCVEKGHRLLVFDYMSNGSLEKWIFRKYNKGYNESLNWHTRKKIILHIVKGLCYLHEDCKNKILHLDIKPQNILLDNDFNAKLGDFGLAKLIDKEDSFAVTQMRGTRGYLAPEWLSRKITEKVDVYSCGIVILEVVFQRKNLDHQNQDNLTLVEIVREKLEENQLFDVIEECCGDDEEMGNNVEEVETMIKVAICCLQIDPTKRPSMSTVTKVLEGVIALEPIFNSTFGNSTENLECTTGNSNGTLDDTSSILVPR